MTVTRLSVHDASAHILRDIAPVATEPIPISDSLGRVLGGDIRSTIYLPPRDNSSMDGFAVRAEDVRGATREVPITLRVLETIPAGSPPCLDIAEGNASRIMTGAFIPAGADCVIRVEDTVTNGTTVHVFDDRDAGRNVRRKGEDVKAGQVVLHAGTMIAPSHIGVLASVGCSTVPVFKRPRVAILATGDELVAVEDFAQVAGGTRIVSSNSYALAAAVHDAGGDPVLLGISADDPGILAEHLRRAEGCDLILTTGGVSVGDFDYTRTVVASLGGELSLWRIRMRPGAPLGFGRLFGAHWLGLPGNPVSALVTFELFGRPLLRMLSGDVRPHRRTISVVVGEAITLNAPLTHFLRITLNSDDTIPVACLTGAQSSGMLTSMSAADALLIVPPDPPHVMAGTVLRALPLHGQFGGSSRFLA